MVIFNIFPIFGQIEYNMVSIISELYRFYSILVEIHHFLKKTFAKLCHNFLRGEGVGFFKIFVTISYVIITLGGSVLNCVQEVKMLSTRFLHFVELCIIFML